MENIGGNALVMKEININLVRKTLKAKEQVTKQQISKATGLSLVTVGTVLQHLLTNKEVLETELISSNGGRPAQQYCYNNNFALALVLFPYEVDRRIIICSAIVNLSGQRVYETDSEVEGINLKAFEHIIESMLALYPAVQVIGFGHPGVEDGGEIIVSDYKGLIGISFTEHFSALHQVPVMIENDVNAAVIGFAKRRKLAEDCTLIYVYFPDQHPPGAGILINGKLFKGKGNYAGEILTIPLGITWNETLYHSTDELNEAIARLIITFCSILNPDKIVLNGNFINNMQIAAITQKCNIQLPPNIVPEIFLSDNFLVDYQCGLIAQTLDQLEPDMALTRKTHMKG